MLSELPEEFEGSNDLLPLGQMGLMMVDWLDPQKTVGAVVDHGVHLDLGLELLKALLTETSRDVRKTIATLFSKLSLPESSEADVWKTKAAFQTVQSIKEVRRDDPALLTVRNDPYPMPHHETHCRVLKQISPSATQSLLGMTRRRSG